VLLMHTYIGDADLTGGIDGDDYFRIDSGFTSSGTLTGYANGDFDYSGNIDADDYFIIDRNYSRQGAAFSEGDLRGGVTAVPEPAGTTLIAATLLLLGRRRRAR
jgi:hypothetical protein